MKFGLLCYLARRQFSKALMNNSLDKWCVYNPHMIDIINGRNNARNSTGNSAEDNGQCNAGSTAGNSVSV